MFINGPNDGVALRIQAHFREMSPGQLLQIDAYCRGNRGIKKIQRTFFLPDQQELPNCFDFKRAVTDALNAVCPQAPDNMEQLPSYTGISEGQGMWSLESLHLTDDLYIIAIIKKL